MRVALLSEVFAPNMGYLENFLPKYLARFGAEVHVITTDLPPYYQMKENELKNTYGGFADASQLVPGTTETIEGFTLHVLPHKRVLGHVQMVGLISKLRSMRPHIVQGTHVIGWTPLQSALAKPFLGYKLCSGNHYHSSVFPLSRRKLPFWSMDLLSCRITRTVPGWLGSLLTERCYAIAPDCADVASRFFGVPRRKITVCPLGVDTELFSPITNETELVDRNYLREQLGFSASDIVCIYTGRFSEDKNPLLLARAVAQLAQRGECFRGLFVGNGVQATAIQAQRGCVIHPFVPVKRLVQFYRASDIGVWPTQESTSMLDAAACGLPVVANDTMNALERLQGNGLTYRLNDLGDLVRVLGGLHDGATRAQLGACGAQKMAKEFSWESIARRRLRDYEAVLRGRRNGNHSSISEERVARRN
jgi:glycosyltransferase involved in cell wall biosynthesis